MNPLPAEGIERHVRAIIVSHGSNYTSVYRGSTELPTGTVLFAEKAFQPDRQTVVSSDGAREGTLGPELEIIRYPKNRATWSS